MPRSSPNTVLSDSLTEAEPQKIPAYPDFISLDLDLHDEIHDLLKLTGDGVSEFTFSNLYLFRNRYQYRIAADNKSYLLNDRQGQADIDHKPGLIISGTNPVDKTKFFMTPGPFSDNGFPTDDILIDLFKTHDYWKNIPVSLLGSSIKNITFRQRLEKHGISISEDINNFDYLYYRNELAGLSGKKFHKKKNLVNAFIKAWPNHEQRILEPELIPDAQKVLEQWKINRGMPYMSQDADYIPSKESLDAFSVLGLHGAIYYVNGEPAAYCLGESIARGTMFCIHFEKGLEQYKGIYQYMNQAFAESLGHEFIYINREQDLGNAGLRQAKMTYRPVGFVKKYRGVMIK